MARIDFTEKKIQDLRKEIEALHAERRITFKKMAEEIGITTKTLGAFRHPEKHVETSVSNLTAIHDYLLQQLQGSKTISHDDLYKTLAQGMDADEDTSKFIRSYGKREYAVLRFHVSSQKLQISRLRIKGSTASNVITFEHDHKTADRTSFIPRANKIVEYKHSGYVFLKGRNAYFISTSKRGYIREMIFLLPAGESTDAVIPGVTLTVSSDTFEPFAARVLLQPLPADMLPPEVKKWEPGNRDPEEYPSVVSELGGSYENGTMLWKLHQNTPRAVAATPAPVGKTKSSSRD